MRKNVNFALLVLVITVLVGTVAITTYFQSTYQEVSEDLETKTEQLEVVSSNFSSDKRAQQDILRAPPQAAGQGKA